MKEHTRRSLSTLCAAAMLVVGCSDKSSTTVQDMAVPMDLAPAPGDLFVPPPADLSNRPPLLLGSVTPGVAPTSGGTQVTISGTGFANGALAVRFGDQAATGVTWVSSNEITAKVPAKPGTLGAVDISLTNGDGQTVTAPGLFRYSLAQLAYQAKSPVSPGATGPRGVVLADFDGDKLVDMATVNGDAGNVTVMKGKGDGTFQAGVAYAVGGAATSYPFSLLLADVDGDGKADLITANQKSNNISILFGAGDGSFGAATNLASNCNAAQGVDAGDLSGDGMLDLAVSCQSDSNVKVLINKGGRQFDTVSYPVTGKPYSVTVADTSGDRMPDIVTANADNGTVSVLVNDGTGAFLGAQSYPAGTSPFVARLVDLDLDGYPELVVGNATVDKLSVLPGTTTHTFEAPIALSLAGRPEFFITGDFDGDGFPDVAAASLTSGVVTLLPGVGDRTFKAPITLTAGKSPNGLAQADLDRDGLPDLVVTNYGDNNVSVFKNTSQ